jgi:hypothetical protein
MSPFRCWVSNSKKWVDWKKQGNEINYSNFIQLKNNVTLRLGFKNALFMNFTFKEEADKKKRYSMFWLSV